MPGRETRTRVVLVGNSDFLNGKRRLNLSRLFSRSRALVSSGEVLSQHLPGLHLGVRHLEPLGQLGALGRSQVLLLVEAALEFGNLLTRERGSWLLALGRRSVLVGVANAAWDERRGAQGGRR